MALFKQCPCCKKEWQTLDHFLEEDSFLFLGYQPNRKLPDRGMFYFKHVVPECQSTLSVYVKSFQPLLDQKGKELSSFDFGQAPGCPGYCFEVNNLKSCNNHHCGGAIVRNLMIEVKARLEKT